MSLVRGGKATGDECHLLFHCELGKLAIRREVASLVSFPLLDVICDPWVERFCSKEGSEHQTLGRLMNE